MRFEHDLLLLQKTIWTGVWLEVVQRQIYQYQQQGSLNSTVIQ